MKDTVKSVTTLEVDNKKISLKLNNIYRTLKNLNVPPNSKITIELNNLSKLKNNIIIDRSVFLQSNNFATMLKMYCIYDGLNTRQSTTNDDNKSTSSCPIHERNEHDHKPSTIITKKINLNLNYHFTHNNNTIPSPSISPSPSSYLKKNNKDGENHSKQRTESNKNTEMIAKDNTILDDDVLYDVPLDNISTSRPEEHKTTTTTTILTAYQPQSVVVDINAMVKPNHLNVEITDHLTLATLNDNTLNSFDLWDWFCGSTNKISTKKK